MSATRQVQTIECIGSACSTPSVTIVIPPSARTTTNVEPLTGWKFVSQRALADEPAPQ